MDSERWARIKEIFDSALDLSPEERASLLDRQCGEDCVLRAEVGRLLDQFDRAGAFLDGPALAPSGALSPGDMVMGRYKVVRLLGRGGMGEAYEAEDQVLRERVALKTLRHGFAGSETEQRRFRKEIQLARRVTHPNVCRVHDVGSYEAEPGRDVPFFSMELLEGETLATYLRRRGRLTHAEAFPLAEQMARGLGAAHKAGIVHRDFKSANVILTPDGNRLRAVVTDFGLARVDAAARAPAETTTGRQLMGTLAYMSPEQMAGGPVTAASDVYSFGVVLYEMATGHLPFDDRHLLNAAVQRAGGSIPGLRRDAPDIDPRWEAIIVRCLRPAPSARFASGDDLARAFQTRIWHVRFPDWGRARLARTAVASIAALAAVGAGVVWSLRPHQPPAVAAGWFEKGVAAFHASSYEAARRSLEVAIEKDPQFAAAHAYLAAALSVADRPDQARQSMLQAVQTSQDVRVSAGDLRRIRAFQALVLRDFERARPILAALAAELPGPHRPAALTELALVDMLRNDLAGAAKSLEKALKLDPTFAPARLRLGWTLAQQRKSEPALAAFAEAERLFQAASQYDALVETQLQRAVFLSRSSHARDALPILERAAVLARSTGDLNHQIRLRLAHSLALQMTGDVPGARQDAAEAIEMAARARAEHSAAVGLLDLGNTYFASGEPQAAEQYFKQGLSFARESKSRFSEARALLSLASLCVQFNRAGEAAGYIQEALPFYRDRGYRLESTQALLLLGGAQASGGEHAAGETSLREAIRVAAQIQNRELEGTARSYLGSLYFASGNWSASLAELAQALELNRNARGGAPAATYLIGQARVYAALNRPAEARQSLDAARTHLAKLDGAQKVRRTSFQLAEAELAYYQRRWADALRFANDAVQTGGALGDRLAAAGIAGAAHIRLGRGAEGGARCDKAVSEAAQLPGVAAEIRLLQAEALAATGHRAAARIPAEAARAFLAAKAVAPGLARARRILDGAAASQDTFGSFRSSWSEPSAATFLQRPDLQLSNK
jgi:eukaryotic-like serine/threonine-protein kinase